MTEQLLQAIWAGILFGSVYGLMAMGMTLIWGALNLLNLAHGALYLVAAYLAWALIEGLGFPIFVAFVLAVAGGAFFGLLVYALLIRPLLGKPGYFGASMIGTLAAANILQGTVLLIFGGATRQLPPVLSGSFLLAGDVVITQQGLAIVAIAVTSLVLLNLFLRNTRHGLAIRAVAQNMDAARLMGAPVGRTFMLVFLISAALAGLAGVLLTSILFLNTNSGFLPMIKALVVAMFGGLGSVKGTIVGALVIGLLESFVQVFMGVSFSLPILFLFIIAVLLVRPQGLFGSPEAQRL